MSNTNQTPSALRNFNKGDSAGVILNIEVGKNIKQAEAYFGGALNDLDIITVTSDCNAPTFTRGDQVFVNTTDNTFTIDAFYAFRNGKDKTIKFCTLMFGKPKEECIRLSTIDRRNGDEYVSFELFQENVIGRLTGMKFGRFNLNPPSED